MTLTVALLPLLISASGLEHHPVSITRADFDVTRTVVLAYWKDWEESISQMIEVLEQGQIDTLLLVDPDDEDGLAYLSENQSPHLQGLLVDLDSPWVRDYGPIELHTPTGPLFVDAAYHDDRLSDDQLPGTLGELMQAKVRKLDVVLEGGGVVSNGLGFCVMTKESLHRAGYRRPSKRLSSALGCQRLTIVPSLPLDDTHHADMFLQFVSPTRAIIASVDPLEAPEEFAALRHAKQRLAAAAREDQLPLELIEVPMEVLDHGEERYRTYINGLRAGEVFFAPRYADVQTPFEESAYDALSAAMPELLVVPIDADEMIELGGAIHCISATTSLRVPPESSSLPPR